jgi:PhoPQ-activated pathogenicity-related protein
MKKNLIAAFVLILAVGCRQPEPQSVASEPLDALKSFVQNKDDFSFEIKDSTRVTGASCYRIRMNSGKWLNDSLVNEPLWWHWLDVIVPDERDTQSALLFIGGGTRFDSIWEIDSLSLAKALQTKSVIAHISNIPFQPLTYIATDTVTRYEDDLIAYGWDKYLSGGAQEKDLNWLARFPMTRAVVRGMDVVETLTAAKSNPVTSFVVSGASKRGWTTWTTAAVDDRVIGMAPLVIDLLNLVPSFNHHHKAYGAWSPAVAEYENFGIMDWMGSEEFDRMLDHVEPYEFREVFTMPKLIVNGTLDEFFLPDSWQFYWDSIPGPKALQYVPNGNHGLAGSYNTVNVFSFFNSVIHDEPLPKMDWKVTDTSFDVAVDPNSDYEIALWQITNPEARDFRIWVVGKTWEKTVLEKNETGIYSIPAPSADGYTASFVEVTFNKDSQHPITLSTGTKVLPDSYAFGDFVSERPKGKF